MGFESTSRRRGACMVGLALWLTVAPPAASGAGRVALVMGNGEYAAIGTLRNPGNDATDMAAALGRLGFDVTTVRDADRIAMTEALRVFTRESAGADVSLVFYAGHGLEMDGVNYLVPVDARLERDTDVRFEAIELDDVLAATVGAGLRVVILDACRNNPLARSMQRTGAARSVSRGSFGALDENLLGDDTLVAYAAAAGTTAADGEGLNSPYTAALLSYLDRPLEIGLLFREVRARVLASTDGRQRPYEYASLLGEHYLSGAPGAGPAASGLVDATTAAARLQQENLFWESIRDSANAPDFEAYLRQFPAGAYRVLAANRLAALRPAASADPPTRPASADVRDCPECPEMVLVPTGTFRMGCVSGSERCYDRQRPVHEVEVASFALSKYEVTRGQFAVFAVATGYDTPGGCVGAWTGSWRDQPWQSDEHPVVCVNWDDAQAYVRWLREVTGQRYRLPSEAEWEYAARAGTTTAYSWGNQAGRNRANCRGCGSRWDGDYTTAPVGSFAANAWGLYDIHGNVREWVEDCWHDSYRGAPSDGRAWTSGGDCGRRVSRGGSWSVRPTALRAALRTSDDAENRRSSAGFRVARTLD